MTDPLVCPKCQGQMRSYERSGITVDQCSDCRGIFLDRGELEGLVDAETAHYGREQGPRGAEGLLRGGSHHSSKSYGGRRKESFLGELFG